MPINFKTEANCYSYAMRQADSSWTTAIKDMVDVTGKQVLDIGCGGGIYTKALADLGAMHVTGIDSSEEMLKGAREQCRGYNQVNVALGDALHTELPNGQYDLILERALIHHLEHDALQACFAEALRLLKPQGTLLVQDRRPRNCLLPGGETHIRGYFFAYEPRLIEKELARRYDSPTVLQALKQAGFCAVAVNTLWETRATYPNVDALAEDLLGRTGRSILHELTDEQLQGMVSYIRSELQKKGVEKIVEQDPWTIWMAARG